MRIHLGNIPENINFQPEKEGLQAIRGLKSNKGLLLASLTGLLLLIFPILVLSLILAYFAFPAPEMTTMPNPSAPLGIVFLALFSFVPLHEFCHLVCHPQFGTSNQSVLVIWPIKIRIGVYFEGCMSRTRWLIMRAAPFVVLSMVPAAILAVSQNIPYNYSIRTFFEVILLVNSVGSGADILAMVLVVRQVPSSAQMCFRGGRAYWMQGLLANQKPPLIANK